MKHPKFMKCAQKTTAGIFCLVFWFSGAVSAATITAVDLSTQAVKNAINAAADGDTVQLPAGSAIWNSQVEMVNRALTIQGAGMDQTIIYDNMDYSYKKHPFYITGQEGKPFRITRITFQGYNGVICSSADVAINIKGTCKNFRVDHCKYVNYKGYCVMVWDGSRGLIDHCTFYINWLPDSATGSVGGVCVDGAMSADFAQPLSLGTSNAVYIEDNYFYYSTHTIANVAKNVPAIGSHDGGRYVARFNTFFNGDIEIKGALGSKRGTLSVEFYNNTFNTNTAILFPISLDGGTAVISSNTMNGTYSSHPHIDGNYTRSCRSETAWGMCDGTSSFDGNVIPFGQPGAGYPCLDQIGRGPGTELLSGVTVQKSEPVYLWNNTVNGSPSGLIINTGCSARPLQIVENRDYYNGIPRPGYTPYTYPHPMAIDDADTSSPTAPGAVYDGTGTDINCAFSTTTLAANWTAGSDNESGISCYQYAISAVSAGGTEFAGWTNITNSPVVRTGLALNPGVTYYFTVKTVNGVGLVSNPANSNGQYVSLDATPPGAPAAVRDGTINGIDISSTTSTTQLSANWDASADAESGISDYRYAIGTSPSAQDVVGWTTTAGLLSITKTGLVLNAGATYYFSVKAVNGAGVLSAASNSNGQVVVVISTADSTLPIMGPVRDGTGTDIASSIAGGQLSANWDAAVDAESGVSSYRYAIGTSAGVADTVAWTNLGNVLTVTRGGLSLTAGTTYYFNVKAINGVGLISTAANSNGQYVVAIDTSDTTPPSAPAVVRDGAVAGADINSTTDTAQLSANWDASADAESGIAGYWYAIGSTPGDTDIRGWTDNGPLTNVTASGLTLTVGVTYYISVQAENGVGLQSAAANSNGQVVVAPDTTGPAVSAVAAQNITQTGATIIWTTDEPSTSQVEYGRSISYGRVTIDNPAMDTAHSVALPELIAGSVYHYRIISRDASNNETTSGDYTFTTSAAAGPIPETIHAYPNPCKISPAAPIKFRAGSGNISEVGIYTVSGRLIKRLSAVPGASSAEINWDGANADGQKVSRGIYIYKLTSSAGDTITGKIVLK